MRESPHIRNSETDTIDSHDERNVCAPCIKSASESVSRILKRLAINLAHTPAITHRKQLCIMKDRPTDWDKHELKTQTHVVKIPLLLSINTTYKQATQ